jgi:hypothetical protein
LFLVLIRINNPLLMGTTTESQLPATEFDRRNVCAVVQAFEPDVRLESLNDAGDGFSGRAELPRQ